MRSTRAEVMAVALPIGGAVAVFTGVGSAINTQFCGAATLPAFRRKGLQTALLRRRLADARDAGCRLAIITTHPGSKSNQYAQRQGFELLYPRAVLVKEPGD